MTDRNLKAALKKAYIIEESSSEKAFLKKYENRDLQIFEIVKLEFKYMGIKSLLAGLLLLAILITVVKNGDSKFIWTVSSALPVCSLVPFILISKSERYGMSELEAASRFSLRFLRVVRMLILGTISIMLVTFISLTLHMIMNINMEMVLCVSCIPYMLNVLGCIMITRRWHSKDSIYACVGITFISCVIPFAVEYVMKPEMINPVFLILAVVAILIVTVRESILYVHEGENLSWNWC